MTRLVRAGEVTTGDLDETARSLIDRLSALHAAKPLVHGFWNDKLPGLDGLLAFLRGDQQA